MKLLFILPAVLLSLFFSNTAFCGDDKVKCIGKNDQISKFSCLKDDWQLRSVVKGDKPGQYHMFFQDEQSRVIIVPIQEENGGWTIFKTSIKNAD